MSATRLLVLGVVRGFGSTHGYRVRAELLSWGIDDWANVKPGSIYHALRQMAKDGLLAASEIADWPGRVDYRVTPAGEKEFFRLLVDALERPEHRADMLSAGLALMPALTRDRAVRALSTRLSVLETQRAVVRKEAEAARSGGLPPHLAELWTMRRRYADLNVEWAGDLLERVSSGEYEMAGERGRAVGMPR
ncbi:PadR family transcriptional regulator [Streptomyces sp. NBC_01275]|uniref:PadR family transcriptional regulator n=1 Tax=Streptomyces sp. NBC_01275 TaxID=2903807 RepID=UPI002258145E|nr:PadR family transcriptional regulator [Streptomyces sp. NBC_01275]MCX4766690.1 PadR family transcriptional regulator [Streptomyces sp. NBC_01275]